MNESPHIFVIGGAGYIGSHTVRHLLEYSFRVVVADNAKAKDIFGWQLKHTDISAPSSPLLGNVSSTAF